MSQHEGAGVNRLVHEKSPYLQQHARNPVDWYPWGDEAIARARREDRPIFLSVGYSTCHWCHVMERESFEDEGVARLLNQEFVCIKVDREEHPDVDQIYMNAVQRMTGQGGWPMSVFLTPELQPFYAGTYFPPDSRFGRPGFGSLVSRLAELWKTRRADVLAQGRQILALLAEEPARGSDAALGSREAVWHAVLQLERGFDPTYGGFGNAPKFPRSTTLMLVLRDRATREDKDDRRLGMVDRTLEMMARGGLYDQVGGGFARYSTDAEWLVPHFEKMLYDNALLAWSYAEGWQATRRSEHRRIAVETLDWVLKEMTHPEGGFHSALDADSEGEEGRFYVWTRDELDEVLGKEDGELAASVYGADGGANFEGRIVLHLPRRLDDVAVSLGIERPALDARLASIRERLYARREERVHPGLDDKILTSWNGLMIAAMARVGAVFGEARFVAAAVAAAEFLLSRLTVEGRPLRRWRDGEGRFVGTLEDWADLSWGMLELFEATGEARWLSESIRLAEGARERFEDSENGGFFLAEADTPHLVVRSKEPYDGATPSGNSVMAFLLLRLAEYTDRAEFRKSAERAIAVHAAELERFPMAYPMLLVALDRALAVPEQFVVAVGEDVDHAEAMARDLRAEFRPHAAILVLDEDRRREAAKLVPWLEGKTAVGGKSAIWACRNFSCRRPVTRIEDLEIGG